MRKAVVFSAALAATCVSAVAVPMTATAAAAGPSTPRTPDPGGPSGSPGKADDTGTPSDAPSGPSTEEGAPIGPSDDGTVSAQAVMVTPALPMMETYSYGDSPLQKVDAYWTTSERGAAPRPAVLFVHGGYWLGGDKGGGWEYFARRLVAEGYVVLSTNYRLAPEAQWPAQRTDVLSALNYLKTHAGEWNADPGRVVVIGSSSGGHLATQIGTYGDAGERIRGVIALSPPNNPMLAYTDGAKPAASDRQQKLRRAVIELLGCDPGEAVAGSRCWKRLQDAETGTHVNSGDVPMLIMHGTEEFVPVTESRGLATALRAAGIEATIKTIEGSSHAGALLNHSETYPAISDWLESHLKGSSAAEGGDGGATKDVGDQGGGHGDDGGGGDGETPTPIDIPSTAPEERTTD